MLLSFPNENFLPPDIPKLLLKEIGIKLFKYFNIITHDVYYSVCKTENGRQDFKELIITNYDIN